MGTSGLHSLPRYGEAGRLGLGAGWHRRPPHAARQARDRRHGGDLARARAACRGFERIVVVKRIIESLSADESFVEMFPRREARIIVQLYALNIVQVFDLGKSRAPTTSRWSNLAGENLAVARSRQGRPAARTRVGGEGWWCRRSRASRTRTPHLASTAKPLQRRAPRHQPAEHRAHLGRPGEAGRLRASRAANRRRRRRASSSRASSRTWRPSRPRHELDGRADVFAMGIVLWELR